jgi:hypothetical protein
MHFWAVSICRHFVGTEKGYFGFAPEQCQEGDLIVILAGQKSPCILRPQPVVNNDDITATSMDTYKILGDAYVHGIMLGEAFELLGRAEAPLDDMLLV